ATHPPESCTQHRIETHPPPTGTTPGKCPTNSPTTRYSRASIRPNPPTSPPMPQDSRMSRPPSAQTTPGGSPSSLTPNLYGLSQYPGKPIRPDCTPCKSAPGTGLSPSSAYQKPPTPGQSP